jgi:outer membrane receptor protein involved in Fe transport
MDGLAADVSRSDAHSKAHVFSQELRLSGDLGGLAKWTFGGTYSNDRIETANLSFPMGTSIALLKSGTLNQLTVSDTHRESYAAFGNLEYKVTPELTIAGGVRYTRVRLHFEGCNKDVDGSYAALVGRPTLVGQCVTNHVITPPIGGTGPIITEFSEPSVSWRTNVSYKPSDHLLLYATVSRGFKSGNVPTISASSDVQLKPVVQERLTSFEIGAKVDLLQNLNVNLAAYHYAYKDKQLFASTAVPPVGIVQTTTNIPRSRVNGFEVEVNWIPFRGFTTNANVGFADSRIGDNTPLQVNSDTSAVFPPATGFSKGQLVDVSGDPFNLSSKWTANANAQYEWSVGGNRSAFIGGSVAYQSSTSNLIGDGARLRINARTLFDARLGLKNEQAGWRFSIWGQNLTNQRYTVAVQRQFDTTNRYNGMPRTYGVTFGYEY